MSGRQLYAGWRKEGYNLHKFFVKPTDVSEDKIHIYEDAAHIGKVLRLNCGDEIIIFDGTGNEYLCSLESVQKDFCVAKVINAGICTSEPKVKVTLFQGVPKSGKMEVIIQKCVELGIYEIYPVIDRKSVV